MAQDSGEATPAPCSASEFDQFDFWVGEWDLTWGEDGRGENVITRHYDGCVIEEDFTVLPDGAFRGMSVSTYNPEMGKWQQTWVDNAGNYLDFVGGLKGGKMILSRVTTEDGKEVHYRMVFYNIAKDSLDWDWQKSEDQGETWSTLWQIHYTRKNNR